MKLGKCERYEGVLSVANMAQQQRVCTVTAEPGQEPTSGQRTTDRLKGGRRRALMNVMVIEGMKNLSAKEWKVKMCYDKTLTNHTHPNNHLFSL